jgi:hypothetical protein
MQSNILSLKISFFFLRTFLFLKNKMSYNFFTLYTFSFCFSFFFVLSRAYFIPLSFLRSVLYFLLSIKYFLKNFFCYLFSFIFSSFDYFLTFFYFLLHSPFTKSHNVFFSRSCRPFFISSVLCNGGKTLWH